LQQRRTRGPAPFADEGEDGGEEAAL